MVVWLIFLVLVYFYFWNFGLFTCSKRGYTSRGTLMTCSRRVPSRGDTRLMHFAFKNRGTTGSGEASTQGNSWLSMSKELCFAFRTSISKLCYSLQPRRWHLPPPLTNWTSLALNGDQVLTPRSLDWRAEQDTNSQGQSGVIGNKADERRMNKSKGSEFYEHPYLWSS
jgi:hypothetical protein